MTEQMSTKYDPQSIEKGRYDWWVNNKFFEAKPESGKTPYTIVIPPPNVTGKLHLGHAWDTTLQDIMTRMKRMQGFDALWLPGMDHAGIATQAKVEGKLKEEGRSRYDLGREAFLEESWKWKDQYAGHIREQWAKLGLGLDYSRERFTLDDGLSKAVREVFVKLYEKKLIYRGKYIINWDPNTKTAISDIEVIYKDVQGAFYHMRYPLADGSGHIEIATTRPETMLGDTAVAVHPKDERYQHLIGKKVILPIIGREIEIVADDYVDREFGSGAVKITPAHDPNDFEIGNRHHLERVLVMHEDGSMNENAGKYEGLDRFECRKQIVKDLQDLDVLFKIEEHLHSVGHSERSGAVVEPYLSTQWFVDMKPLAAASVEAQKNDAGVNFVPDRFEKTYLHWMENIRDWCISRQLWWGHQIPAWYHNETGEIYVGHEAPADAENWTQDEDVLDTWFSSALWPFSTLGWPEENDDLSRYYPTDVLVTGYDIINFWVSRMIFQALEFTGEKPFKDVLIHGLVRDAEGRKMSKSLGNGVDPMDVISEYGADSLRYFLATASSPGQDLRYANDKVESVWNFANKIWNASRFALMNMEGMTYDQIDLSGKKSVADSWILTRLNETIEQVTELAERYEFGEVGRSLYNFIWDDFCDWYIEMSKLPLYGEDERAKKMTRSVLAYVLDNTMRLLHPFMPFITEEIWQNLPHEGESITIAAWPTVDNSLTDQSQSSSMKLLMDVIRSVRTIRAEVQSPMSKKVPLTISAKDANTHAVLEANAAYIERFCNPETLTIGENMVAPEKSMSAVVSGAELFMPLEGLIDIDAELARLGKEREKWAKEVKLVSGKLSNERFVSKAPEAVVAEERAKQADYLEKHATVEKRIEELKNL
ncbi:MULTISPECIES: valine--tRNA ligase [unclassified Planococcus (in: firmicutes)]|uniref:valine--tRNA ligase n=1 Tax=Planococcus TaxID=1372 RepID=UPI0011EC6202|nr:MULTISPECIES: valine--tRNA ligase [unclassified Planococcus (in: firmicutes)]KAA0957867.1 valine--tRNA ligase [Planococcus sp. ANT_H30]MDJ0330981.1 valine--tRNA ligase [Planococcus sp. S3-L1]